MLVAVAIGDFSPFHTAVAVLATMTAVVVTIIAVAVAVHLRADDRAGGHAADDSSRDRTVVTRESRLRRGYNRQCQSCNCGQ